MFNSIRVLLTTIFISTIAFADVFITEIADPNNQGSSSSGIGNVRFVELYNNGDSAIDLSTWALQRWTNGNADPQSAVPLIGSIGAGEFYVVCNGGDDFAAAYVGSVCNQDIGTGGPADSNGDDNIALLGTDGSIVDMFGVAGEDGTGTGHEFEDGRAERAADNTTASATWDEAGWNIDNDSGGGDGAQNAPEGFDPAAWIGAGAVADPCEECLAFCTFYVIDNYGYTQEEADYWCSTTSDAGNGCGTTCGTELILCDDVDACNNGEEGNCVYPSGCDEECGSTLEDDECGVCGGDNSTCSVDVAFSVDMSVEGVVGDVKVRISTIDGTYSPSDWFVMGAEDGNTTFHYTMSLIAGKTYGYNFNNSDGSGYESGDNLADCAGGNYGNDRYVTPLEDMALDMVCWESCDACPDVISGCTDETANNYNPAATEDDGTCTYPAAMANLFFSEHAEGSSNNKYFEVYNASDVDVSLADYAFVNCSNGCDDWEYTNSFADGAEVSAGSTYTVCHSSFAGDLTLCDETRTLYHNGDDAQGLVYSTDGTLLDVFGAIGDDPGSGWEVAGVSNATKDHTLVRKSSVSSGNTDWAVSAGTSADDSEWVVFDQNTWDYMGSHPHEFAPAADYGVELLAMSFEPANLNIEVGQTVEWVWVEGFHNVNGSQSTFPNNPEGFQSDMGSDLTFSFTFNLAGHYDYQCDPHAGMGMVGTITVGTGGCMDEWACNYNADADFNNNQCDYPGDECDCEGNCLEFGCTDASANNYNPEADMDDGSCVYGCSEGDIIFLNELNAWSGFTEDNSTIFLGAMWNCLANGYDTAETVIWCMENDFGWIWSPITDDCFDCHGDLGMCMLNRCDESCSDGWTVNDDCDQCLTDRTCYSDFESCSGITFGCDDTNGCNYDETANVEAGYCEFPDLGHDCEGNCVEELDCNGVCGGGAFVGCSGECDNSVVDECGICNGGNVCADTHICSEIDNSGNADWVTCPSGADYLCAASQSECYEAGCSETGLPDCAGDGDCCPAEWLSDGFCDDSEQWWGCDLSCYDGELEDDCDNRSSNNPLNQGLSKPIFSFDIETREECDFVWGPDADCAGVCGGEEVLDECLECGGNGPGENFDCEGDCLVDTDCNGVCGGLSVSDDCGDCWSPYCYDMGTHIPDYMTTEEACNEAGLMWVGPGGAGGQDPTWNTAMDSCGVCDGDGSSCDYQAFLMLTENGDVIYNSTQEIYGFQFGITGTTLSGASGGAAADSGFQTSTGVDTVLGFSFTGSSIPAGTGVLVSLSFNDSEADVCLSDLVISGPGGSVIAADVGDGITAPGDTSDDCVTLASCMMGDLTEDGEINLFDVLELVQKILLGNGWYDDCADLESDGEINLFDVLAMVNIILNPRESDATSAIMYEDSGSLNISGDGYIGGIQMILSHGADFSIDLTNDAFVSEYRTNGNETMIMVIAPNSDEIFKASGNYKVEDIIVTNKSRMIEVTQPSDFILSEAYPNPFNPSTTLTLNMPMDGYVSIKAYNLSGQVVGVIKEGYANVGSHTMTWDASSLSSGVYIITAEYAGNVSTQKVMLMK